MSLKPKFVVGDLVFIKKMGLSVIVRSITRGHPNRYLVDLNGYFITVTESCLALELAHPPNFGKFRKLAKFRPKQLVFIGELSSIGIVVRTIKYAGKFHHHISTPSRKYVFDESKLSRWKSRGLLSKVGFLHGGTSLYQSGFSEILFSLLLASLGWLLVSTMSSFSAIHNRRTMDRIDTGESYLAAEISAWGSFARALSQRTPSSLSNDYTTDLPSSFPPPACKLSPYVSGCPQDILTTKQFDSARTNVRRYDANMNMFSNIAFGTEDFCGNMVLKKREPHVCLALSLPSRPCHPYPNSVATQTANSNPGWQTFQALGPTGPGSAALSVAFDSRGGILVGGNAAIPGSDFESSATVTRFSPDLTLDTSFGSQAKPYGSLIGKSWWFRAPSGTGSIEIHYNGVKDGAGFICPDKNGNILIANNPVGPQVSGFPSSGGPSNYIHFAQFSSTGSLDPNFSTCTNCSNSPDTYLSSWAEIHSTFVNNDGTIFQVGSGTAQGSYGTAPLSSLQTDWSSDLIFANSLFMLTKYKDATGTAMSSWSSAPTYYDTNTNSPGPMVAGVSAPTANYMVHWSNTKSVLEQPNGKIVVFAINLDSSYNWNPLLIRFNNTDGTLDKGFNGAGYIILPGLYQNAWASATLQTDGSPDGKIIIAGRNGAAPQQILVRLKSDGSAIDTTFSVPQSGLLNLVKYQPNASDPSGKTGTIWIVGNSNPGMFVDRLDQDGHLLSSYTFSAVPLSTAYDMDFQLNGKAVVVGSSAGCNTIGQCGSSLLVRLTETGVLDGN